jgi:Spy/CpxP family protein refolding chaperone
MIAGTKIKLTLLGIFVLGIFVGVVGDRVMQVVSRDAGPSHPDGRESGPNKTIDMLTERLKLRPDQVQDIDAIVDQAGQEYMKVRTQIRPQFDEIRNRQRNQIQAILDPQQQESYNQLIKEWEQRRRPPASDRGRGR